jgi:hypothetical protein
MDLQKKTSLLSAMLERAPRLVPKDILGRKALVLSRCSW